MASLALSGSSLTSRAAVPRLPNPKCTLSTSASSSRTNVSASTRNSASSPSLLSSFPVPPLSFDAPGPAAPTPSPSLDPSSAFATVWWASGGSNTFNTQILVGENESTESVVRRFKKACLEANIVNECRRRRYFETKQDIVKRKQKENARKRKRLQRANGPRPNFYANQVKPDADKAPTKAVVEEDEEDWNAMVI